MVQRPHHPFINKQTLDALVLLFWQRPKLFWGSIWLVIVLLAWTAASSLISPGFDPKTLSGPASPTTEATAINQPASPSPQPIPSMVLNAGVAPRLVTPSDPKQQQGSGSSTWLMAGIGLVCTMGAWLILKGLQRQRPSTQFRKPLKSRPRSHYPFARHRSAARKSVSPPSSGLVATRPHPVAAAPSPNHSAIPDAALARQKLIAQYYQRQVRPPRQPRVTVVPPEQAHPLDLRGEVSLADMLDIRKRRSNFS